MSAHGISPDATKTGLIPGSVEKLDQLSVTLRAYAHAFTDARRHVKMMDEDEWSGTAAIDFRKAVSHIPKELDKACDSFARAGQALHAYARVLEHAQNACKPLIEDAAESRAQSRKYQQDVDDYNAAVARDDTVLPDKPPAQDPGAAAMDDLVERLNKLRVQVAEAGREAKRKLDAAAEDAPDEPGWFDKFLSGAGNFGKGLWEGAVGGLGNALDTALHPSRWGMTIGTTIDSVVYGVQHPKEFAKAVADWDTLTTEPARWTGRIMPDAALSLAGGAGAATRGSRAASRLAERMREIRRTDKGRDHTDERPEDVCRSDGDKCKAGEPVDIATGEMSLTRTDIDLACSLPLQLARTHLSGYRAGCWFGPSWASTLDQHLEVDERGIVYAGPDGQLLAYPHPECNETVLPEHGPRWPLDHNPADGSYRLHQPQTGRTLTFTPLPDRPSEEWGAPLTEVRDRQGRHIRLDHDPATGYLTAVHHSGGHHLAVDTHPEMARVTALRLLDPDSPNGPGTTLVRFEYDEVGNLIAETNSSSRPLTYTYDEDDRITTWTDRNGTSFGYVYDHGGRVLRTLGPDGMWSGSFRYLPDQRTTVYTDSLGNGTTYEYDEHCKLLAIIDPLGNTRCQTWTPDGQYLATVTDALGHTIHYEHDQVGNLLAVRVAGESEAQTAFDELNLPTRVTRPGGAVWRYCYDESGCLLSAIDPAGAETSYTYDEAGHLSGTTNALGHTRRFTHDAAGRRLVTVDTEGGTATVTRDAFGRPTTYTDPLGVQTHFGWTVEGQPAHIQYPDGTTESWGWDGEGNLLAHTDRAGRTTTYSYTHFDLVASRTDTDGNTFRFDYDTELRLTRVTNPSGLTWTYLYDEAGRLTAETDFNGRTLTYTYDAAGRLRTRTNGAGEMLTYMRDARGRVTTRQSSTGERATFTYDAEGRTAVMSNADATVGYTYDALGRTLTETVNGRTMHYAYDALGRRTTRTTPTGLVSTWRYSPEDQPIAFTNSLGHVLDFGYNAGGQEIYRTVDATSLFLQTYDAAGRLASQSLRSTEPGSTPIQEREYHYRADGILARVSETYSSQRSFTLTPTGRVTAVDGANWAERYAYDATGNITTADTRHAPEHNGTWETTGTLLRRSGRTRYTYDGQGRLVERTRKLLSGQTKRWTYCWNAEDRLTEVNLPDDTRWRYAYDPVGRRVAKYHLASDGTRAATDFAWDGTRLAERTEATGRITSWDYEIGGHRPLTQTTRVCRSSVRDPRLGFAVSPTQLREEQAQYDAEFHAIITDLVGTPTELVTPTGKIAWRRTQSLWGAALQERNDGTDCPLRFPGQYEDEETGLFYNNQRYYDPHCGRYVSPDPLGLEAGDNEFTYPWSPLVWSDPLGLAKCPEERAQKAADKIIENAEQGKMRKASNYHPHFGDDRVLEILKDPDAVYLSEGGRGNLIFRQGEDIVVAKGAGAGAGDVITGYGPSGVKGDSGADALGGSPSDPGPPIRHDDIVNGKIPGTGGTFMPPAKQIR
ncbi:putative T7SS-secreted protein [Streptomyces sp. NPDC012935]|uniref:putative T7SS-secreted protein n=1 Tax=Streptomyces sp. NPDC012935 TaxID=3364857 RepID=UPI0036960806